MQIYYCKPAESGKVFSLDDSESQHIAKVMRMNPGDELLVCNGRGKVFRSSVMTVGKKVVEVSVGECIEEKQEKDSFLHIAIAPTKNINRFEWFLEKATEIGVSEITPFLSENSERKIIKPDRLEKIIVSAMKQSKHLYKPELHEMTGFKQLLQSCTAKQKFIAYCEKLPDTQLVRELNPDESACILIGPEGDFTPEEVEFAKSAGFKAVALGNSRLRTETAGIVVAQIVQDIRLLSV